MKSDWDGIKGVLQLISRKGKNRTKTVAVTETLKLFMFIVGVPEKLIFI